MNNSLFIGLIQNTAILLAFSMIYHSFWVENDKSKNFFSKIAIGFVIGLVGIVLMLTPWTLIPGIVFDTRSILLSVSGLFFGALPTIIAMIIMGIFRVILGGAGVWMGIAVIAFSGAFGILWNKYRPLNKGKRIIPELVALGFLVHITMLGCTIFLPAGQRLSTLKTIAIPVLSIYPFATAFLGTLMFRQYKNWQNRKASEKLHESERRFSDMLKDTMLFSAIIDADAKISFCNESLLSAAGYTVEEVTGKNWFEVFIEEESRDIIENVFRRIIAGDRDLLIYENNIILKNGSKLLVSWHNNILKDVSGTVTGVASIGENITKKKEVEAELIQARIKAEESDMLKSIFLANMSHEIRTPMNAIMGFSALLGEQSSNESDKAQYLDIIKISGNRLLNLINDIMDLSKLEAKQLTINKSECSLSEIIINSTESFRKSELLLSKPGVELILKLSPAYKTIIFFSDGLRIQQVLDNLISNAIKYTEKGRIETGCSIRSEDGKDVIEIYVKDTGIGISSEKSDLVFDRFRQVEEGKFHQGAGLGLSISRGIVDLLGGKMRFISEINTGSTFFFSVPYVISEGKPVKSVKTSEVLPQLNGKNIIIAEDDFFSFRYLQLLLRGQGANILHAENGRILMNMVQISLPDLILLDINMPIMTGYEFLSEMQSAGLKIKVIAQTAYAMPEEKERCLSAGCNGYISKPISKTELFNVINAVLSEK